MSEFKTEREEVKIEDIVQEVTIKAKKNRNSKDAKSKSAEVIIFIVISGILGLLASSLIFNLLSESFQNDAPKPELINKN